MFWVSGSPSNMVIALAERPTPRTALKKNSMDLNRLWMKTNPCWIYWIGFVIAIGNHSLTISIDTNMIRMNRTNVLSFQIATWHLFTVLRAILHQSWSHSCVFWWTATGLWSVRLMHKPLQRVLYCDISWYLHVIYILNLVRVPIDVPYINDDLMRCVTFPEVLLLPNRDEASAKRPARPWIFQKRVAPRHGPSLWLCSHPRCVS